MYDTTGGQVESIPLGAPIVAGYVDGYAWSDADWERFPNAKHVTISVEGNPALVGDVERGGLTAAKAVELRYNTIYMTIANWPTVKDLVAGVDGYSPNYWVAAIPGIGPELYAGSVAHQFYFGPSYDESVVADYWEGLDPVPVQEDTLRLQTFVATVVAGQFKGVNATFVGDGSTFRWVENQSQLNDIVNGTGPYFNGGPLPAVWADGKPVADPMAFGTPANATTASMLGLTYP